VVNGEGGIRTLERGQPPLRDFQSRPFNRSGTSPGLACGEHQEGYDTARRRADRLAAMLLAASQAFSKDVGLLITFLGIGVIVNVILVIIALQIRGERQQNRERRRRHQI
jgi:hypothetical protein